MEKQYARYEELKDIMGSDSLLEALVQALSSDELKENIDYIIRMHDIILDEDEMEDEE